MSKIDLLPHQVDEVNLITQTGFGDQRVGQQEPTEFFRGGHNIEGARSRKPVSLTSFSISSAFTYVEIRCGEISDLMVLLPDPLGPAKTRNLGTDIQPAHLYHFANGDFTARFGRCDDPGRAISI